MRDPSPRRLLNATGVSIRLPKGGSHHPLEPALALAGLDSRVALAAATPRPRGVLAGLHVASCGVGEATGTHAIVRLIEPYVRRVVVPTSCSTPPKTAGG